MEQLVPYYSFCERSVAPIDYIYQLCYNAVIATQSSEKLGNVEVCKRKII